MTDFETTLRVHLACLRRTLDHLAVILEDTTTTRDRALDKLDNARCQMKDITRALTQRKGQ